MTDAAAGGLDALDRRLLHRLAEEVRPDLAGAAAEVGTTEEDARRRYERLLADGVIRECVARIDPAAVGAGLTAYLLVRVAQNADNTDAVRRVLGDMEAVEEAHAVTGDFDWLVKVRAPALADVQRLVTERLPLVPGFIRAQTCLVLDTACERVNADLVRLAGA